MQEPHLTSSPHRQDAPILPPFDLEPKQEIANIRDSPISGSFPLLSSRRPAAAMAAVPFGDHITNTSSCHIATTPSTPTAVATPPRSRTLSPKKLSREPTTAFNNVHSSNPDHVPPALRSFLGPLRVPTLHLAPVFIKYGFDSEGALDFLSEIPLKDWEDMRAEILQHGRLASWLAIQHALERRARTLQL